jgi:hypothetical protein
MNTIYCRNLIPGLKTSLKEGLKHRCLDTTDTLIAD